MLLVWIAQARVMDDPLLSRLDSAIDATECPGLDPGDLLALATWWLVERVGLHFGLEPWAAAAQVAKVASEAALHMETLPADPLH